MERCRRLPNTGESDAIINLIMCTAGPLPARLYYARHVSRISLWMVILTLVVIQNPLLAQSGSARPSALRSFHTKDGVKFTARIVSISTDGKQVVLRTADEIEHPMETTALSLENQIFVRDWIEAQVARQSSGLPAEVKLKVEPAVTKFERRTFTADGRSVTHEEMHEAYRMTVSQPVVPSRVALRVSYLILYWEKIAVYEVADGKRTDWSSLSGRGRVHYRFEKIRLPLNRQAARQERITVPIKIDRLEGETEAERLGHDQLIGIYVRCEDPFGNVVAEFTDLPEAYAKLGWTALNAARQEKPDIPGDSGAVKGVLNLSPEGLKP